MRVSMHSLAALILGAVLLPSAATAQQTVAHSFGGVVVDGRTNRFLAAAATGGNCVFADANGTVAGAATYVNVPPLPAGTPAPPCAITFTTPPLSALGALAGFGQLGVSKFPPPVGTGNADAALNGVTAGGVTATASASWTSSEIVIPVPLSPTVRDATLSLRTNVVGRPGLAVALSQDPWFFHPQVNMDLQLSGSLFGIDLLAEAEPGDWAVAQFEAFASFGSGSVPGSGTLRTFAPFVRVVRAGQPPLLLPSATWFAETIPLEANQTYWLTVSTRAGALTAVPEPSSALLGATGIVGVLLVRAARRGRRATR